MFTYIISFLFNFSFLDDDVAWRSQLDHPKTGALSLGLWVRSSCMGLGCQAGSGPGSVEGYASVSWPSKVIPFTGVILNPLFISDDRFPPRADTPSCTLQKNPGVIVMDGAVIRLCSRALATPRPPMRTPPAHPPTALHGRQHNDMC